MFYVPHESSFVSTQFFVLNLMGWFGVLSNKFFDIPLLSYYIKYQIINKFSLFSRDIYLSLSSSLSFSFVIVTNLVCCEPFETFVRFHY